MTAQTLFDLDRPGPGDLAGWDVILVSTSAGKDSQTMLRHVVGLAEAAGVLHRVTTLYCDLGRVVWPGTKELAQQHADHYGIRHEVRRREQNDLLEHVEQRGMWPSSAARYCTSDHKRGPGRRMMTQLVAELELDRPARVLDCQGLRGAESAGRARKQPFELNAGASNQTRREVWTWLPIHDWTTDQVWDDIRASGVPYHHAYDLGMSRLSCSLCVLASKADLVRAVQLRPDLAAEYAAVEARIGHRFRADLSMRDLIELAARPVNVPAQQLGLVDPYDLTGAA